MRLRRALDRELAALRAEVTALRGSRVAGDGGNPPHASSLSVVPAQAAVAAVVDDADWQEIKTIAKELADEVANLTRQHPGVSVLGAFALGLLLGTFAIRR